MSNVEVLTEEQYEKIISSKEKIEKLGYKIEETDKFIVVITPDGEKYIYAKPHVSGEVEQVELPREGKLYKAVIKRIKIDKIYKLLAEKGFNVEALMERCKQLEDPRQRYQCIKRYIDIGYLIEFEIQSMSMEDWQIIRYSTHPNSNLRKLSTSYKVLKRGMEVWVQLTEKGRFKIVPPPEEG